MRRRIENTHGHKILSGPIEHAKRKNASAYGSTKPSSHTISQFRKQGYRNSMIGARQGIRRMGTEIGGPTPQHPHVHINKKNLESIETGSNRPSAGFKEPSSRRYDPYSKPDKSSDKELKPIETGQNRPSAGFQNTTPQSYNPYG